MYRNAHFALVNVTLEVSFKFLSIHKVRQSGPKLRVFDATCLELESKIRIYRDEETV